MQPEQEFLKNLGLKIKEIRTGKGLSLSTIAEKFGFEKASLSRLETGHVNATIKTLYKLSQALEVPIGTFFED
jgi:transcriptional regulator with XRE-family HTH domain